MDTVQKAREALGARLRGLRLSANLTGRVLAQQAGWDNSKVSRFEHGKQMPTADDIRTWCALTDATPQIPDLIAAVRDIDASYLEWRRVNARRIQQGARRMEAAAEFIRGYDPQIVPGILQTREYATAVLNTVFTATGGSDIDTAVTERMDRYNAIRDGHHRCHFVVPETALYLTLGGDDIMTGQLEHLLTCLDEPWLTLSLLPNTTPLPAIADNFHIFDGDGGTIVRRETMTAGTTITDPTNVALYEKTFTLLADHSLTDEPARTLIRTALTHRTDTTTRPSQPQ